MAGNPEDGAAALTDSVAAPSRTAEALALLREEYGDDIEVTVRYTPRYHVEERACR